MHFPWETCKRIRPIVRMEKCCGYPGSRKPTKSITREVKLLLFPGYRVNPGNIELPQLIINTYTNSYILCTSPILNPQFPNSFPNTGNVHHFPVRIHEGKKSSLRPSPRKGCHPNSVLGARLPSAQGCSAVQRPWLPAVCECD